MITREEREELLAVCRFIERSPNLDREVIYTCEDRHGTHSLRVSVLRRIANACPAGGEHTWALQEEAGTGRIGWACDECHAPLPDGDD